MRVYSSMRACVINFNSTQIRMMRHKMYEKIFKSTKKMTNRNDVTHNTKHTILIIKTKFTPYSVPPAHVPASVFNCSKSHLFILFVSLHTSPYYGYLFHVTSSGMCFCVVGDVRWDLIWTKWRAPRTTYRNLGDVRWELIWKKWRAPAKSPKIAFLTRQRSDTSRKRHQQNRVF